MNAIKYEKIPGKLGNDEDVPQVIRAAREFIDYLRVERGASKNTLDAYRRAISHYVDYLVDEGILEPDMISQENLLGYAWSLDAPRGARLSPASLAQVFSAIRTFHRFLLQEGMAVNDPSIVLVSPKIPSRLPRALSHEQIKALLDSPGSDVKGLRDRMILEMLYATGMRISELVGINIEDLDLPERTVLVRGKGGKWRMVPFGKTAQLSAINYLEKSRPKIARASSIRALVLNMRGGRMTRQGCWKALKTCARSVGLEEIVTPHSLRHTFATHMLEGGASLPVVQELLGHASLATTQIYTEVTAGRLKEVYLRCHPRA
ncbi:MAG: tyrosine recombinase XerD [Actinomycetota bacterium]|nr:tyrosine recombinase XerD [Actinomycetota bacterium]